MSPLEALDKVCKEVESLCGSYNSFKAVAVSCFDESDELKCAVAIIGAASGGKVSDGTKQIDAIFHCVQDVQDGKPIGGACKQYLEDAGVPVNKINEAYGVVNTCAKVASASGAAAEIDAVIICADTILDSSIAKEADLGIPSWVDSLFDIYGDIKHKDYWSLVYHVGATVVCLVAEYFAGGIDVCGFLKDIAAVAGAVYDAAGDVVEFIADLFKGYQAIPVDDYYAQNWLSQVTGTASNMRNTPQFDHVDPIWSNCLTYYTDSDMSAKHAQGVCDDMRDGSAFRDPRFVDRGFVQLVTRWLAYEELTAAIQLRINATVALANQTLAARKLPIDLNAVAASNTPPGYVVENGVQELYGLNKHLNAVKVHSNDVTNWPPGSIGLAAVGVIAKTAVSPKAYGLAIGRQIADSAIKTAEANANLEKRVAEIVDQAYADRVEKLRALKNISSGLASSVAKPLNDTLALCVPKATASCEAEVRARFKVCDAKAAAFYDANAGLIGDFDNKRGQDAMKKWGEIRATCEAEVKAYVLALPNVQVDTAATQSCKPFLGRPTELLCPDTASFVACQKQVDIGEMKSCRQTASTEQPAYTKETAAAFALGTQSCKLFLGRSDELLCNDAGGFMACRKQVDMGKLKTCRQTGLQQVYTKSSGVPATGPGAIQPNAGGTGNIAATLAAGANTGNLGNNNAASNSASDTAATKSCKPFLGRADELLCPDVVAFNACKVQVDNGKMKTCRQTGSQAVYQKSPAAPPATTASTADACKPFLGRADEMLCTDASTYAACKAQVDGGTMKTCRMTGSSVVYAKLAPAMPPVVPTPAAQGCKPYLGRADEMLCNDASAYAACKAQVDNGSMKTCRQTGSQQVYSKPGGMGLAPPIAITPKIDEAALKLCKAFLGRKDEMLCNEAPSFAACKTAVDAGRMKTCRLANTQEVYPKR